MYVNVNVDVDDVLDEMTDDEVRKLFDARFSSHSAEELWVELYDKRRALPPAEFLRYLDAIIMDKTGRIL